MLACNAGTRMRRAVPFLLGCAIACAASPVLALGLQEAYELAVRHDPTWQAARHENEAAQQFEVLGRSHLLPNLSASYAPSRNTADVRNTAVPAAATDRRRYSSLAASILLRQPLFNAEGMAQRRQGIAQTAGSNALLAQRRQELIVRVVSLYTFAKYSEDLVAQANAQQAAFQQQREANQRLFQRGEGTRTEVLETQARSDLAAAQLLEADDNLANARAALGALIGQEVTVLDALDEATPLRELPKLGLEQWQAIALSTNPELEAQRYAVEVAREEVAKNSAGHLPRVDLVASVGRNDSDTINTFNQRAVVRSVGLQVNVPIYSGGATSATVAQSAATLLKVQDELQGKTDAILLELRKQHNITSSSVARIGAASAARESARLLVQATTRSIQAGQRTNVDALNAQQQLFEAQRDLSQARYNHLLATLRLSQAAGTLAAVDVTDIARSFRQRPGNPTAPVPARP
jgi:protease secretion system outer membrane protein